MNLNFSGITALSGGHLEVAFASSQRALGKTHADVAAGAMVMLYQQLGPASLVAVTVLVLMMPLQVTAVLGMLSTAVTSIAARHDIYGSAPVVRSFTGGKGFLPKASAMCGLEGICNPKAGLDSKYDRSSCHAYSTRRPSRSLLQQ